MQDTGVLDCTLELGFRAGELGLEMDISPRPIERLYAGIYDRRHDHSIK